MITLKQAAAWCGGAVLPEYENVAFTGASVDSRILNPGELFVAIRAKQDGHDYIGKALEAGAAAVLAERQLPGVPTVLVPDSRVGFQRLAAGWRDTLTGTRFIGLTGSAGKTTTKEMLGQICSRVFRTQWTQGNLNNELGVPKTLLELRPETELAVIEMGMNDFGQIALLTGLTRPEIAVITNIGNAHIGKLGSREGICRAKLEILEGLAPEGVAVLHGDEPLLRAAAPACRTLWFGLEPDNDLRAEELRSNGSGIAFTAVGFGQRVPVELPVPGEHNAVNALAAMLAARCVGVPLETAAEALRSFKNTGNRLAVTEGKDYTVIADCYNASPDSMSAALKVLRDRPTAGRRIAVLGDMLELDAFAPAFHASMGSLAAKTADLILAYGPESRALAEAAGEKARWFGTHEDLLAALEQSARPGDTILFKASHGMHLELVLKAFFKE